MTYFLLMYAAVYGGMNAYLFWQAQRAFALTAVPRAVLGLWCLVMVTAPILTRVLELRGFIASARALAFVGYSWMAAAFWLFLLFTARDLWNLAAAGSARFLPQARHLMVPLRRSTLFFLTAVVLAGLWGLREARDLRLETVTIRTSRLPAGSRPVRIGFVSDLHIDLLVGDRRIRQVAGLLERARPDVILSGGDLLDASAALAGDGSRILADLQPPLGKFAVTGNHEYYAGIEETERFTAAAGFRLLHGQSVSVGGRLLLVGVDDPTAGQFGLPPSPSEDALLPREGSRLPVVLVKHRPEVAAGSTGRFDLQLSGHTHRGQIYPFRYFVSLLYPRPDGLSAVGGGSWLYKGRGTGTWGPPIRFLASPEVTLVLLIPAE